MSIDTYVEIHLTCIHIDFLLVKIPTFIGFVRNLLEKSPFSDRLPNDFGVKIIPEKISQMKI